MKVIEAMTPITLNKLRPYAGKTLNTVKPYAAKTAAGITATARTVLPYFPKAAKRVISARAFWLFTAELAGVVLIAFGISLWSIPAALIIGGLVLVAAIEVRPHVGQRLPNIPPPVELLRAQAENAAVVINTDRYGLGAVDTSRLADLTPAECERLILAARAIGASKT
jgi:hypothetical protein